MKPYLRWYHPILFGIIPVLTLFQVNFTQVSPEVLVRPIILSALFALISLLVINTLIKNIDDAALITTFFIFMVYSYGHIYNKIENQEFFGFLIGRHRIMIIVWFIIIALGIWLIRKKLKTPYQLNRYLNVVGLVFIAISILQIGYSANTQWRNTQFSETRFTQEKLITQNSTQEGLPDIYYIILDAYARDDVLKSQGFDNSEFIRELEELGFYVAKCSQSNYGETLLSLSTSLNKGYLESFAGIIQGKNNNPVGLSPFIINNTVQQELRQMGYKIVATETGIAWDEMPGSDIYLTGNSEIRPSGLFSSRVSNFEILFIRTTIFRLILEAKDSVFRPLFTRIETPEETQYKLILSIFDNLNEAATIPGPKFVFSHIVSPHFPYVFDEKGDFKVFSEADPGYYNNIRYVNKRTIELVKILIEESKEPPVIVIQGDHGQNWDSRLAILNAYYFPGGKDRDLYPTISPVNTFRVIFNTYLGKNEKILPDQSALSTYDDIWNFTPVQYPCDPDR
jgi:hypothetical protein